MRVVLKLPLLENRVYAVLLLATLESYKLFIISLWLISSSILFSSSMEASIIAFLFFSSYVSIYSTVIDSTLRPLRVRELQFLPFLGEGQLPPSCALTLQSTGEVVQGLASFGSSGWRLWSEVETEVALSLRIGIISLEELLRWSRDAVGSPSLLHSYPIDSSYKL